MRELPNSAVFGARFRVNAGRALLLPRSRGRKRTPFWLQRMKARDLLATVRNVPDFPIMAETYRDCLRDVMDLGHLDGLLTAIEEGRVKVLPVHTRVPSPLAAGLLYKFISTYMYEWDTPKAEQQLQSLAMRRELVEDLLEGSESGRLPLKPEAVESVVGAAAHTACHAARTAEELSVLLLELGDLTEAEVVDRSASGPRPWLAELSDRGTIQRIRIPTGTGSEPRWVIAEFAPEYGAAFGSPQTLGTPQTSEVSKPRRSLATQPRRSDLVTLDLSRRTILTRWLRWAGPVTRAAILDRYAFDPAWLDAALGRLLAERALVQGHFLNTSADLEYCDRAIFEQVYRRTLNLLRREVQPVPLPAYQAFLLQWQNVGESAPGTGPRGRGAPATARPGPPCRRVGARSAAGPRRDPPLARPGRARAQGRLHVGRGGRRGAGQPPLHSRGAKAASSWPSPWPGCMTARRLPSSTTSSPRDHRSSPISRPVRSSPRPPCAMRSGSWRLPASSPAKTPRRSPQCWRAVRSRPRPGRRAAWKRISPSACPHGRRAGCWEAREPPSSGCASSGAWLVSDCRPRPTPRRVGAAAGPSSTAPR